MWDISKINKRTCQAFLKTNFYHNLLFFFLPPHNLSARCAMCDSRYKDDRQHYVGDIPTAVHVCRNRGTTVQGKTTCSRGRGAVRL